MVQISSLANCFSVIGTGGGAVGQVLDLLMLILPVPNRWPQMRQHEKKPDFARLACREEGKMKVKGTP